MNTVRKYFTKARLALAAIVLIPMGIALGFSSVAAHAALTTVSATTHIYNDPDSGNNGDWATDGTALSPFARDLVVTQDAVNTAPVGFQSYHATVNDAGIFVTHAGAFTPNQVVPGQKISHTVIGQFTGSVSYTITAPAADMLSNTVLATLNDNNVAPSGAESLGGWPQQAFTPSAGVAITLQHFDYNYVTPAGETWTDADTNGEGNLVNDGNITGIVTLPAKAVILKDGHGTSTGATRETVSFLQTGAASWDMFTIVGPGAINGHQGWVNGQLGFNTGVYSGLLANHTYTSCYVPVTGPGSSTPIKGHGGCIVFVSNH
jgi:hypothetical protein